jgi:hypothetical protein
MKTPARRHKAHGKHGALDHQNGGYLQVSDENANISNHSNQMIMADGGPRLSSWPKRVPAQPDIDASPSKVSKNEVRVQACNIQGVLDSPEVVAKITHCLESGSQDERHAILSELRAKMLQLALSRSGCRIVQKAIEVAGGTDREMILNQLKDHITQLYESPHGNHVLTRAIEVLPVAKAGFVISALTGRCITVAKHRFGCRVICRLIEHCGEAQIYALLDELISESDMLARHVYGTYVVQSILEHMSPARRSAVLHNLLPNFVTLIMHRSGSLVVQRALDYCGREDQALVLDTLHKSGSLVDIACSHFGSYVIEQLASMRYNHDVVASLSDVLMANIENLRASEHTERVISAFGLATASANSDSP